jgi:hypothetical protein
MKLMMSDYKVEMVNDGMSEFYVEFHGPQESPYQDGTWKIRVELPEAYPYKSPSIGFVAFECPPLSPSRSSVFTELACVAVLSISVNFFSC